MAELHFWKWEHYKNNLIFCSLRLHCFLHKLLWKGFFALLIFSWRHSTKAISQNSQGRRVLEVESWEILIVMGKKWSCKQTWISSRPASDLLMELCVWDPRAVTRLRLTVPSVRRAVPFQWFYLCVSAFSLSSCLSVHGVCVCVCARVRVCPHMIYIYICVSTHIHTHFHRYLCTCSDSFQV